MLFREDSAPGIDTSEPPKYSRREEGRRQDQDHDQDDDVVVVPGLSTESEREAWLELGEGGEEKQEEMEVGQQQPPRKGEKPRKADRGWGVGLMKWLERRESERSMELAASTAGGSSTVGSHSIGHVSLGDDKGDSPRSNRSNQPESIVEVPSTDEKDEEENEEEVDDGGDGDGQDNPMVPDVPEGMDDEDVKKLREAKEQAALIAMMEAENQRYQDEDMDDEDVERWREAKEQAAMIAMMEAENHRYEEEQRAVDQHREVDDEEEKQPSDDGDHEPLPPTVAAETEAPIDFSFSSMPLGVLSQGGDEGHLSKSTEESSVELQDEEGSDYLDRSGEGLEGSLSAAYGLGDVEDSYSDQGSYDEDDEIGDLEAPTPEAPTPSDLFDRELMSEANDPERQGAPDQDESDISNPATRKSGQDSSSRFTSSTDNTIMDEVTARLRDELEKEIEEEGNDDDLSDADMGSTAVAGAAAVATTAAAATMTAETTEPQVGGSPIDMKFSDHDEEYPEAHDEEEDHSDDGKDNAAVVGAAAVLAAAATAGAVAGSNAPAHTEEDPTPHRELGTDETNLRDYDESIMSDMDNAAIAVERARVRRELEMEIEEEEQGYADSDEYPSELDEEEDVSDDGSVDAMVAGAAMALAAAATAGAVAATSADDLVTDATDVPELGNDDDSLRDDVWAHGNDGADDVGRPGYNLVGDTQVAADGMDSGAMGDSTSGESIELHSTSEYDAPSSHYASEEESEEKREIPDTDFYPRENKMDTSDDIEASEYAMYAHPQDDPGSQHGDVLYDYEDESDYVQDKEVDVFSDDGSDQGEAVPEAATALAAAAIVGTAAGLAAADEPGIADELKTQKMDYNYQQEAESNRELKAHADPLDDDVLGQDDPGSQHGDVLYDYEDESDYVQDKEVDVFSDDGSDQGEAVPEAATALAAAAIVGTAAGLAAADEPGIADELKTQKMDYNYQQEAESNRELKAHADPLDDGVLGPEEGTKEEVQTGARGTSIGSDDADYVIEDEEYSSDESHRGNHAVAGAGVALATAAAAGGVAGAMAEESNHTSGVEMMPQSGSGSNDNPEGSDSGEEEDEEEKPKGLFAKIGAGLAVVAATTVGAVAISKAAEEPPPEPAQNKNHEVNSGEDEAAAAAAVTAEVEDRAVMDDEPRSGPTASADDEPQVEQNASASSMAALSEGGKSEISWGETSMQEHDIDDHGAVAMDLTAPIDFSRPPDPAMEDQYRGFSGGDNEDHENVISGEPYDVEEPTERGGYTEEQPTEGSGYYGDPSDDDAYHENAMEGEYYDEEQPMEGGDYAEDQPTEDDDYHGDQDVHDNGYHDHAMGGEYCDEEQPMDGEYHDEEEQMEGGDTYQEKALDDAEYHGQTTEAEYYNEEQAIDDDGYYQGQTQGQVTDDDYYQETAEEYQYDGQELPADDEWGETDREVPYDNDFEDTSKHSTQDLEEDETNDHKGAYIAGGLLAGAALAGGAAAAAASAPSDPDKEPGDYGPHSRSPSIRLSKKATTTRSQRSTEKQVAPISEEDGNWDIDDARYPEVDDPTYIERDIEPEPKGDTKRSADVGREDLDRIEAGVAGVSDTQAASSRKSVKFEDSSSPRDISGTHVDGSVENDTKVERVHSTTEKDKFIERFRNDRKIKCMLCLLLLSVVGLAVGLSIGLTRSSPTAQDVEQQTSYVQVGENIDGPGRTFEYGPGTFSRFGQSVSISANGTRIAVGAPEYTASIYSQGERLGLVQVFEEQDGEWVLQEPDIIGELPGDAAGSAVSLSADGTTLAVGSPEHLDAVIGGQVILYEFKDGFWQQLGSPIIGDDAYDRLGSSVSLSGDGKRVAISKPTNKGPGRKKAMVYERRGDDWEQLGADLIGRYDADPVAISASGDSVALGSLSTPENNYVATVGVYRYNNETEGWELQGQEIELPRATGRYDTRWAPSLSANGTICAIGSAVENPDNATSNQEYDLKVVVYRYNEENDSWTQLGETLQDIEGSNINKYGVSLSADGQVLAIGNPGGLENGTEAGNAGVLRLFEDEWVLVDKEMEGTDAGDLFGWDVSISSDGKRLGVGAPKSGVSGKEVGGAAVFEVDNLNE